MDPSLLTTVTHRAMATEFAVLLPPTEAHHVEPVLECLEMLDQIEAALTIYRETSEIAQVNREAAHGPVGLSPETFSLLCRADQWSRQTEGAFDITAGPLVEAWGFTSRSGRKPSPEEIELARAKVGYKDLLLNRDERTVQFAKPGMSINLGAIGKGDALDRLAQSLSEKGVRHFLIHGGQSSVLARGDQEPGSGQGWAVGISHPTKPQRRVTGVWLRDTSLATSGSGKQFFHHQGQRFGHVIDPRTGYPAGDLLSLTAITASAADADACATGFFVAGSTAIEATRHQSAELPAMLGIRAGKRQDEVTMEAFGDLPYVES